MSTITELESLPVPTVPLPNSLQSVEDRQDRSNGRSPSIPSHQSPPLHPHPDPENLSRPLPPVDGGPQAWKFLFGAFMIEAFQWGFALTFGVFQNYYSTHPPFASSPSIPIIGTLATGVLYLGAPLMTPLVRRYPRWHRQFIWVGWTVSILVLVAASFARTVAGLVASQGVMYSVGVTVMYFPIISMLNEWFVAKRGLALGVVTAATGVSGIAMPFVLASLLDRYGYPTTLRAFAGALVVLTGPVLPMLRGRVPVTREGVRGRGRVDLAFLGRGRFWGFGASVLLQGLGYFYPMLFLPSYASALGYGPNVGALLLALFSFSQVPGQIVVGYLSDNRVSVETLAFLAPAVSAVAILTLWGMAHSLSSLIVFSLVYGVFGGGYVVLWAKMGMEVSDEPTGALVTFGIFAFLKGVGNVITGPISAALVGKEVERGEYGLGKYRWIVAYSGACMGVCAGTMVVLVLGRRIVRSE